MKSNIVVTQPAVVVVPESIDFGISDLQHMQYDQPTKISSRRLQPDRQPWTSWGRVKNNTRHTVMAKYLASQSVEQRCGPGANSTRREARRLVGVALRVGRIILIQLNSPQPAKQMSALCLGTRVAFLSGMQTKKHST